MNLITETPEHPIERLMNGSFGSIRTLVDADTVIGTPVVTADGKTVMPVSKVSVGFVTGGGEFSDMSANKKNKEGFPFGGGSGGGMTVKPVGFLISDKDGIKMLPVEAENGYDKLLGLVPDLVEHLIKGFK